MSTVPSQTASELAYLIVKTLNPHGYGSYCFTDPSDADKARERDWQAWANVIEPLLKPLDEDAHNGGEWFNAFQTVNSYMLHQGLWDEQDVDQTDPAKTLITAIKRLQDQAARVWSGKGDRPRVLTPIERALECGALVALLNQQHTYEGVECRAAYNWAAIRTGLKAMGVIGYVKRSHEKGDMYDRHTTSSYAILYELFPDDADYYGLCGDGYGDLFAVAREGLLETVLFD